MTYRKDMSDQSDYSTMNKFLLILILIFSFQSWTKADDISDFQIEGMSIGDSALDYFSEKEINDSKKTPYENKKWATWPIFKNYTKRNLAFYSSSPSSKS